MKRDAHAIRDGGPTVFASIKHGEGVQEVIELILDARERAGAGNKK